jgi:hypothetical protein
MKLLAPYGIVFALVVILIAVLQKDLGQVVLLGSILFFMLIFANRSVKVFLSLIGVALSAIVLLIIFFPHRINRIQSWWSGIQDGVLSFLPEFIAVALRVDEFPEPYQVSHSLNAISHGGWFGVGLSEGGLKLGFLSEVHTDFVLAGITEEIGHLNVNAIEQTFEPGSVIKPIAISLVLDKRKTTLDELFPAYNKWQYYWKNGKKLKRRTKKNSKGEYPKGAIKVGRWTIKDDHQFQRHILTLKDVIIYSSNIGTLLLANRLSAQELLSGYHNFGIGQKTGIDLPYEKVGSLPKLYQLRAGEDRGDLNVFKSTISYGQGMTSSFMQILRAYSVFNNDGKITTPMIVKKELINEPKEVLSKRTANRMKKFLVQTVEEGTGKKALYDGLEIGGKTGTANIARGGQYKRKYMSSFFGFANDENNRYTIGVTVNNPISTGKYWYYYYASNSAVPVFKEMVDTMVKLNYLTPKKTTPLTN